MTPECDPGGSVATPFTKMDPSAEGFKAAFAWKDISAKVSEKTSLIQKCWSSDENEPRTKTILDSVSGLVKPGELCAILGASGAGKTTLLNCLTFRNLDQLTVTGSLFCNGQVVSSPATLTSISAFVQQEDIFIGTLTVSEHLTFQAKVRMSKEFDKRARETRVKEVMELLGLEKCQNVLIGVQGRIKGISGGEAKRLSFASELLTDPAVFFCDEPTSGLDSHMALTVVKMLRKMAKADKTIIVTIHQPSSQIFQLFDKVLLMASGKCSYFGPTKNAEVFFNSLGFSIPSKFNPADYYIYCLADSHALDETIIEEDQDDEFEKEKRSRAEFFAEEFAASHYKDELDRNIQSTRQSGTDVSNMESSSTNWMQVRSQRFWTTAYYKVSCFSQFRAVLWRTFLATVKDPMAVKIKIITCIIISLIFGLIYLDQDYNQEGIQNINGALFILVTNLSFDNLFSVITVYCTELPVFLREHASGMYGTAVYFFAKQLVDIPIFLLSTSISVSILYWMVGMNPDPIRFLSVLGIGNLLVQTVISFGYLISSTVPSLDVANNITSFFILPFMLVGGFFLNVNSIPAWLIWVKYLSWFFFANKAFAILQWEDVQNIACKSQGHNATQAWTNGTESITNSTEACMRTGAEVLQSLNFDDGDIWECVLALVLQMVIYRSLAFFALWVKGRKRI